MRNYFETDRVIIPFKSVARVSKALDKNGKVYSVNVFLDGAESGTFSEAEALRFLTDYKRWLEHADDETSAAPHGGLSIFEQ